MSLQSHFIVNGAAPENGSSGAHSMLSQVSALFVLDLEKVLLLSIFQVGVFPQRLLVFHCHHSCVQLQLSTVVFPQWLCVSGRPHAADE